MSSKPPPNVGSLLQAARTDGTLSATSIQALQVIDIGAQIQAGLGIAADMVQASEVVLVSLLIDDSGSIRFAGNAQTIRDGHNMVIDALKGSKQKDGILFHTRYLNGEILNPYGTLDAAKRMDSQNYDPSLGTPLYDETAVLLGTVLAKTQEFGDNGVPIRGVSLVLTDGHDENPRGKQTPNSVRSIVTDMLMSENHIIAAMGIDDGNTDFRRVFKEMGFRDEWILTPANSQSEIRKAFQVFSQSAQTASQNAASFSQTALGGFGK